MEKVFPSISLEFLMFLWAFSSPGWASTALSAFPWTFCAPASCPAWWWGVEAALAPVYQSLSGKFKTEHTAPDVQAMNREDSLPESVRYIFTNSSQKAVGFLCCKSVLLARVQLGIHQDLYVDKLLPAHFFRLSRSLWVSVLSSSILTALTSLVSSPSLLRVSHHSGH